MTRKRPLFLLLAVLLVIAAIWTSLLLLKARPQTLDEHVRALASQLKCPVCQDESVADSPAWVAQQMRAVIRQQIQDGKSDPQIIQYFQQRYGDKIVWTPQWQGFSLLTWLVPLALLLVGLLLTFFTVRDWQALSPRPQPASPPTENAAPSAVQDDLAPYRAMLAEELAAEDPLFEQYRTEQR